MCSVRTTQWGGGGEEEEGYKMISWDAEFPRRDRHGKDNEFSLNFVHLRCLQDIHANAAWKWRGGCNLGRRARQKYYIGSDLRIWRKDSLQRGRGELQNFSEVKGEYVEGGWERTIWNPGGEPPGMCCGAKEEEFSPPGAVTSVQSQQKPLRIRSVADFDLGELVP